MKSLIAVMAFLLMFDAAAQKQVSGYITDKNTGEALIGVSVFTATKQAGTTTNSQGFYTLNMHTADSLCFSYTGYKNSRISIQNLPAVNLSLEPITNQLSDVTIVAAKNPVQQIGSTQIDLKQLYYLPVAGGEKDLIKSLQLLPGVKKGADGTASMLVRGGAHDQNLILLDDAPVYNPSHLLGFFSLFNTDAIKDASLQTGGFSAQYGGRLSSVLDIHTNEGNSKKMEYSGSAGLLASRFSAQGPMMKGKGSFLAAGRISYINKVFELAGKDLPFYFYDFNFKANYHLTSDDKLMLSFYNGDDILNSSKADSGLSMKVNSLMGNRIASLRWAHAFDNKRMYSNTTLFTSSYRYKIYGTIGDKAFNIYSGINDVGIRYNIHDQISNNFSLKYGTEYISHTFNPKITELDGEFNDNLKEQHSERKVLNEGALYISGDYKMTPTINLQTGFRYSFAENAGKVYHSPEPRISLSKTLNRNQTVSLSYARMVQYMFLLSGSSAVLPTDIWYGVNKNIAPQKADIYSAGYQYNRNNFKSRVEAYYKPMHNLVEYREGTTDFSDSYSDENIVQGKGKAYGLEWNNTITFNKLQLTVAYTLSWANRTFSELNNGQTFSARYDRRHDISIIGGYEISKRMYLSAVWTYASGSWFTPVTGHFMMPNGNYTNIDFLPIYSGRNAVQLSASHRLDVNFILKNKPGKRYLAEWHFGAYNVYNQTQPYRIKMTKNNDGSYTHKQMGLFGFVPSVTYQFKF